MKIGIVLDDGLDSNDGVQQYVRTLGKWLTTQNHDVHYLAGQTKQTSPNVHSLSKNITIRFNGNRLTMPLVARHQKIRLLLEREQFDVLHVQMPYSPLMASKVIMRAGPSTAIIGTFHVLPFGKLHLAGNYLLGMQQRHNIKCFDAVCSVSAAAAAFAKRAYGLNTPVIPNMIDSASWKNKTAIQPGKLVFLGRLVARKGCHELLLALRALPAAYRKKLQVVIAGDGPQRGVLEKLARDFSLDAVFTGYVSEADKRALLASADIAVFPSLGGESFGIVLLEAMAAGAGVVVGGNNPGYSSVLGQFPECLIDFTNTHAAAQQLMKLLDNKQLRLDIHQKQQQAIKKYDIQTVGPQIITMYEQALQSLALR